MLPHPVEQLPPHEPWHLPPQATPQVLVQRPLQRPLQPPLQPVVKSPTYGSSISQEVSNDGMVTAAIIGNATEAAFLKKFLRLYFFSSIIL